MPDHLNNKELFKSIKIYQVHAHSRTYWKYNKNECHFYYGCYFTEKTNIAKPIDSIFINEIKQEILLWRNTLLRQVKGYIDNNLNTAKVHMIDPPKDNFAQPLIFQKILDELEIS